MNLDPTAHLSNVREHVERAGVAGFREFFAKLYLRKFGSHPGRSVYDDDWDVLVVLDACRTDLMREVADDYPFLGEVGTFDSPGSHSQEWMAANFGDDRREEIRDTAYVTANPFSEKMLDADSFAVLDEVWRYAWDDELGTVPPRPVTDRAISVARERSPDRLVVHYMQPHVPFVAEGQSGDLTPSTFGGGERFDSTWTDLQTGELDRGEVWESYRANLELALDDVALLAENVDADRLVVTADHGNALGEWGVYEHPQGVPLSCLRRVPWCVTDAEDRGEYDPDSYRQRGRDDPNGDPDEDRNDLTDRLAALGYAEGD
ncbi:hypothetical protein [Halorussus caseinilyticus]|uniref:hypothetical protein n=1 Tax=Halorussus caseinilyticus TaxID=3034025 RepID=UPI0023E80539|nr:hypothetical protein [Halorussus sp. DT72]